MHQHRPEWPNGNYLFALVAHPSGPKGQPDTGAGSKPITASGLPKACSVSLALPFAFIFRGYSPIEYAQQQHAVPWLGTSSFPSPDSPVERARSFVRGDTGYGARGAVAQSRLRRLEDGRYEYRPKRGVGVVLTAVALLLRLLALVPPRGLHLTRYSGVFAPNAALRSVIALPRPAPPPPPLLLGTCAPLAEGPRPLRRPRLDWAAVQARTFGNDALRCPCGGRRAVVAVVTNPATAEEVLRNLGLLTPRPLLPPSQGPPQLSLGL